MRNPRSIIIILAYIAFNAFIVVAAFNQRDEEASSKKPVGSLAPEYTQVEDLNYFHLKEGKPQMSLNAVKMISEGEEVAEFFQPKGIYNYQAKKMNLKYQADHGKYRKQKELLTLDGDVILISDEAEYLAQKLKYFFKKDLIMGSGGVTFKGDDLKTKDHLEIHSESMRAHPEQQFSHFTGSVNGRLQRKKKYEGAMTFSAQDLEVEGQKSLVHLQGDVKLNRQSYLITAGKGDIYLENFNKSLKYFVFNDDVKVTETIQTPKGTSYRKAFSERLEGFGREEKMVLSGAPRVEHGEDVVKGYRITIREKMDLIEVDDALSDVLMKREDEKKK